MKALLKGLGYFLLFEAIVFVFACLVELIPVASIIQQVGTGGSAEAYTAALIDWSDRHQDGIFIGSNLLVVAVFLLINRNDNQFKSIATHKIDLRTVLVIVGIGILLSLAINYIRVYIVTSGIYELSERDARASSSTASMPIQVVRSAIIAPIVEEIVFHGTVFMRMKRGMPVALAAVLSSVCMAIAHFGGVITTVYAAIVSLVLIYIICCTSSLLTGIIAHAVYNLTCIGLEYLPFNDTLICIIISTSCVMIAVLLVYLHKSYVRGRNPQCPK